MVGGYSENPETGAKLDRSQVQVRDTDIIQLDDLGKWIIFHKRELVGTILVYSLELKYFRYHGMKYSEWWDGNFYTLRRRYDAKV